MIEADFIEISRELDSAGLVWHPEIGDEVSPRSTLGKVSILFDPQGLTPTELRTTYLWLPTVEQLVRQFEARQALIFHAGINQKMCYETVVRTRTGLVEVSARSLRLAFGLALKDVINDTATGSLQ